MNKKENMEEIIIDTIKENEDRYRIHVNYLFDIEVDEGEYYVVRRKPQYPKTYEECAKIMNCPIAEPSGWLFNFDANIKDPYYRKIDILMGKFTRLLICRDAYWKIAGEEMGLGKPWEPTTEVVFCISRIYNRIELIYQGGKNDILEFPTPEIRNAFYENFKDLIEECKELL
jgi:hypothetical protein